MKRHDDLRIRPSGGFTLMELLVVLAVLALLAGALMPVFSGVTQSGRVGRVLKLYDTLKVACDRHRLDTGTYAREYAGGTPANRQLSATQTTPGWKGPYIELPLTAGDNPFSAGGINVYNTVTFGGWIPGFDVDGTGALDVSGAANMLFIGNVSEEDAREVDRVLDRNVPGNWNETGRVRWVASGGRLLILISRL